MDLTVIWPPLVRATSDDTLRFEIHQHNWLVQCKLGGYMRPAEREELTELAERYGCTPVLAGGRNPVKYTDLSTGGALAVSPHGDVRPDSGSSDR